ncbi:hypothetical protein ADICYQ_4520 [Cyclobacterium qasimii M12-11B]|uniref:Uncharacterized protein n=1 Tax=Cyclobacterium qasimii M12-11B TaxID=641524 RepID=S7V904_9BACT|nr:hypothetical protein ADICYQ_4520 [Cyclobacterium qasimii M12-11B]
MGFFVLIKMGHFGFLNCMFSSFRLSVFLDNLRKICHGDLNQ